MMSANYDFEDYDIFSNMAPAHLDDEVGQGAEQTIVIRPDRITADVMITPRLLVIARGRAKGAHYTLEVVLVLQADVLFD
jgi:hypothetical protein